LNAESQLKNLSNSYPALNPGCIYNYCTKHNWC